MSRVHGDLARIYDRVFTVHVVYHHRKRKDARTSRIWQRSMKPSGGLKELEEIAKCVDLLWSRLIKSSANFPHRCQNRLTFCCERSVRPESLGRTLIIQKHKILSFYRLSGCKVRTTTATPSLNHSSMRDNINSFLKRLEFPRYRYIELVDLSDLSQPPGQNRCRRAG